MSIKTRTSARNPSGEISKRLPSFVVELLNCLISSDAAAYKLRVYRGSFSAILKHFENLK